MDYFNFDAYLQILSACRLMIHAYCPHLTTQLSAAACLDQSQNSKEKLIFRVTYRTVVGIIS